MANEAQVKRKELRPRPQTGSIVILTRNPRRTLASVNRAALYRLNDDDYTVYLYARLSHIGYSCLMEKIGIRVRVATQLVLSIQSYPSQPVSQPNSLRLSIRGSRLGTHAEAAGRAKPRVKITSYQIQATVVLSLGDAGTPKSLFIDASQNPTFCLELGRKLKPD